MLQNPCKTFGFKKKYGLQNSPWGEVNHIPSVTYWVSLGFLSYPKVKSEMSVSGVQENSGRSN